MVVTLYFSPRCQHCKRARQWLKEHRIRLIERNVMDVKNAQEMADRTHQSAVPAFIVERENTERVIIGFHEEELKKALGLP